jgi:hypothetical protein
VRRSNDVIVTGSAGTDQLGSRAFTRVSGLDVVSKMSKHRKSQRNDGRLEGYRSRMEADRRTRAKDQESV